MQRSFPAFLMVLAFSGSLAAQPFTRADSLRGSITPERGWWDLVYCDLDIHVNVQQRSIRGSNKIYYRVIEPNQLLQIDLQEPLVINEVTQEERKLEFTRDGNAFFIRLDKAQVPGELESIKVSYSGKPRVAENAPWDGGFSWHTDPNGAPFVATSCQELGASMWWPCKDHNYDEPDSMSLSFTVPSGLTAVSNGRLREVSENNDKTSTFRWFVSNPIGNYVVNLNIARYEHFSEKYKGLRGDLDCDYYVLSSNLEKARKQFEQVPMMLEAFEYWFGPYPFYEDGYKLVEVPYLGMEHQSSVTYGNKYRNGYRGMDLSGSGWGLKFDFIIIHESGHEWFGNNITYRDIADMWVHEGFTNYSEALYVHYHYGKEAGDAYARGVRQNILNDIPVTGPYNVNRTGSKDMYAKGAAMLHTLRQIVNNDDLWRKILVGLNEDFHNATVSAQEIEDYMAEKTGRDLKPFFDQYLRTIQVPTLEYYFSGNTLAYRWINVVEGFEMPVKVKIKGKEKWLVPTNEWKHEHAGHAHGVLEADPDFYIAVLNTNGE